MIVKYWVLVHDIWASTSARQILCTRTQYLIIIGLILYAYGYPKIHDSIMMIPLRLVPRDHCTKNSVR